MLLPMPFIRTTLQLPTLAPEAVAVLFCALLVAIVWRRSREVIVVLVLTAGVWLLARENMLDTHTAIETWTKELVEGYAHGHPHQCIRVGDGPDVYLRFLADCTRKLQPPVSSFVTNFTNGYACVFWTR
jgi:hypothetical protein